jgi:hypothetical protein
MEVFNSLTLLPIGVKPPGFAQDRAVLAAVNT